MDHAIHLQAGREVETSARSSFVIDTTFVLFFLAVDFGHSAVFSGIDLILPLATLLMFIAVPYFLPSDGDRPEFGSWVLGRTFLAAFGVLAGLMFSQVVGTVLPDYFRHLPMTFLIISAIFSCYIQFYGIIKVRLAR